MKLVERGAAPERERIPQKRMREDLDERPADDKVLLNLEILDPWRLRSPFGDVVTRNYSAASTSALT